MILIGNWNTGLLQKGRSGWGGGGRIKVCHVTHQLPVASRITMWANGNSYKLEQTKKQLQDRVFVSLEVQRGSG